MAKVSARSRNQYSVVGDSGKVVGALEFAPPATPDAGRPSAGPTKPESVWSAGRGG